ncbi:MAG: hypothetical protein E7536_04030 [Ruminococcaceae bacterium]|nr:hypothetical protein [Oscillospiraceae bacterium]
MKIFVPSYFEKFACIADKCPDTCCIGWEVDIDAETAEKYSLIGGSLGKKIKKHLAVDETGCNVFTLCDGDRCPFLDKNNLCEIHANAGEKALSKTCTLFPRFFDDFGTFREMGLGFACPEAARIILEDEKPFSLIQHSVSADEDSVVDESFLEELFDLREEIFSVLENKNQDFRSKIRNILYIAEKIQKEIDGDDFCNESYGRSFDSCIAILENMEYIKPERREFLKSLKTCSQDTSSVSIYQSDFEKLMKYYIFRYLFKSVYDYDVLTKVKYGVFALIVVSRIYGYFKTPDSETRAKIMYSFSKEVEYSDSNMDLLDEMLYSSFSTEDLINLL